jgi:LPS-assembly protein
LALPVSAQPPSAAPAAPPQALSANEWLATAAEQERTGDLQKLKGNARVEDTRMIFEADYIEWNEETGDLRAQGSVHFRNLQRHEEIWCDRLEYNTETETGKMYKVRGQMPSRPVTRPGLLSSTSPLYMEGEWAERNSEVYTLHNGFITNCKMPSPWWKLEGPEFTVVPGQKATVKRARFLLRGIPAFYLPYFYEPLTQEQRKSGFLLPNIGNSSKRGILFGLGYFWAINRSYDLTYRVQDYTTRGYAHNVEFAGIPRKNSEFYAILYAVDDKGRPGSNPAEKFSGFSIRSRGQATFGKGWTIRGDLNYVSSFRFQQEWSQSYNELLGSEMHSSAFVNKNWSGYTFDAVVSRLQNFQSVEVLYADPVTNATSYIANAVTIRKTPEAELGLRDQRISASIPVWYSFDAIAGIVNRTQPVFSSDNNVIARFQTAVFMNRIGFAPRVATAFHLGQLHIAPSFGIREMYYAEGQAPLGDRYRVTGTNIVSSAREFGLDLVFPSLARVFDKKTVFGDRLKHVIEPRVAYRYVTGVGDSFHQFIRFDENDLLTNTNEVLLSIANRIYAKRGDSVDEIFTWEVMQKRYFDTTFGGALISGQRSIFASAADLTGYAFLAGPRSASPLVSRMRVSPIPGLGVIWQTDYEPSTQVMAVNRLSVEYHWKKVFVSGGNDRVRTLKVLAPRANEYTFSAGFGNSANRGWNASFDGIYDFRASVLRNTTTQVTYNTDCCGFSVQYHRYNVGIRDDAVWRIAFAVANIGTFGNLRRQDSRF